MHYGQALIELRALRARNECILRAAIESIAKEQRRATQNALLYILHCYDDIHILNQKLNIDSAYTDTGFDTAMSSWPQGSALGQRPAAK